MCKDRKIRQAGIAAVLAAALLAGGQLPASANEARIHRVIITEFEFQPASLKVSPGDTVIWTNRDIVAHTATAIDQSWNTGLLRTNESASIIVGKQQSLKYYCLYHPMMKARLRFTEARRDSRRRDEK